MAGKFNLKMPDFNVAFRDLLHTVNVRHGTHSFTSLPKEGVVRIFFALKNPMASAGFEPPELGILKASTLPLDHRSRLSGPFPLGMFVPEFGVPGSVVSTLTARSLCHYMI
jgi:hypothetical protein